MSEIEIGDRIRVVNKGAYEGAVGTVVDDGTPPPQPIIQGQKLPDVHCLLDDLGKRWIHTERLEIIS